MDLQITPRLTQSSTYLQKIDNNVHTKRADYYFKHLAPFIRPGCALLDLGAGSGMLSQMLKNSLGLEVRAFDVEQRSLSDLEVELYDGINIPLEDKSVDVSICVSVLHHTKDPIKLINELSRVTRERLILVEDRFDSLIDRACVIGFHYYLQLVESMTFERDQFRSTSEWCKLIENSGMYIEQVQHIPPALFWFLAYNTVIVARADT